MTKKTAVILLVGVGAAFILLMLAIVFLLVVFLAFNSATRQEQESNLKIDVGPEAAHSIELTDIKRVPGFVNLVGQNKYTAKVHMKRAIPAWKMTVESYDANNVKLMEGRMVYPEMNPGEVGNAEIFIHSKASKARVDVKFK